MGSRRQTRGKTEMTKLELFWYWIREREAARIRKESGAPKPWSSDFVLNTFHFCNVRREDDRGTREIRAAVLKYLPGMDPLTISSLPSVYTMARMFNYAPSVEFLLSRTLVDGATMTEAFEDIQRHHESGAKIFHPAYVISTAGRHMSKTKYIQQTVEAVQALLVPTHSLYAAHAVLSTVNGLGGTGFLAAQIIADLRNDRYLVQAAAEKDWCCPGPGSLKGMAIIHGASVTMASFGSHIEWLYDQMPQDIWDMEIHAQDLQNCLCEFSKYVRYLENSPGRRRYYHGE